MQEEERPSSLMTDRQRKFLRGESELSQSGDRAARRRIRERLQAALFDVSLIHSRLPLDDIDKAFEEPDDPELGSSLPLTNTIPDLIALLYIAFRNSETSDSDSTHDGWFMEHNVETGIEHALNRLGVSWEVIDVDITIERGEPLDELADQELSSLSRDELKQLLIAGEIDSDEFAEAITEKQL